MRHSFTISKILVLKLAFCVLLLIFNVDSVKAFGVLQYRQATLDTLSPQVEVKKQDTTINGNLSSSFFPGLGYKSFNKSDTLQLKAIEKQPFISLQQMLEGQDAGLYTEEPSGEPGTKQYMFIRGLSNPLLNKKALYNSQPAVYVNGIPIVTENPFAYDIQQYDFNRIGPAMNDFLGLDPNEIASMKVIKDPVGLATLGPNAANGAIWITTKNAHSGYRQLNINSYVGFVQKPMVNPFNATYEDMWRQPFYDKYATDQQKLRYPIFLKNKTDKAYYGSSDWTDLYYKNKPIYGINFSLTGGSNRANFRFLGTHEKTNGTADGTSFDRYGASFFINMLPEKWLVLSSMIKANRQSRNRNHGIRDRLAEQRYLPDLTEPLSPNKNYYGHYFSIFDKVIDENRTLHILGNFGIKILFGDFTYNGKIALNYNKGIRQVFWPTELLGNNNFMSDYFGYNQRFIVHNTLSYDLDLGGAQKLQLLAGQDIQKNVFKYNYGYGYNGPNDFIKINLASGSSLNPGNHVSGSNFTSFQFPAKMETRLVSYYLNAAYHINDDIQLNAIVRSDGSSNVQPAKRWFLSYGIRGDADLKDILFSNVGQGFSTLKFQVSYAKLGKLFNDIRFGVGPQYTSDLGWTGMPTMGSYVGIAGLSRPFTNGWIGNNIPWKYSNKLEGGLSFGFWKDKLVGDITLYKNDDKNLVLPLSVPKAYGYTGAYESGMWIQNMGVDVNLQAKILNSKNGLSWIGNVNFNLNKNTLKALPGGLNEIIIGNRKLKVGHAVDQFWLLTNRGIYENDNEVPNNPITQLPMSYHGIALQGGDPRWKDENGDFVINGDDKKLQGHFMPQISGGIGSQFKYKRWSLDFLFSYVLGRNILNQYASRRMDFINSGKGNSIASVKEITYWEYRVDRSKYPMYNPWSDVVPYRDDQDLFLEDGSFLKLKSLSLSYDITNINKSKDTDKERVFKKFLIYISATNVFTLTSFDTDNPELVQYNGVYDGYGLPIPRAYTVGVKIDL